MTTLSRKQKRDNQLRVLTALLLISIVINVTTIIRVTNRPVEAIVVHKVDNATVLHGKITGKQMVGKLYTIDCGAYGKFLVSKEQYDNVQVGDDIPSYLKGN
ncbi:ORF21 [Streptococcus phage 01205]|uniref:ORF21 n=1 Tax=Streptococcus phage O1205 TaxID=85154 RepID=O34052_BPO12|nr:ORF21 [Streptococcus phage 01205]AAC79537.1 ORF21 [Streptococcus phage 01205]